MAIQERRGNYADLDPSKLVQGEPFICLDKVNGRRYAGIAVGPNDVMRLADFDDLEDVLIDCEDARDEAVASASSAADSESNAEAWAVGERGGVPVTSGDDTYENNSKYYAELAKEYEESAAAIVGIGIATTTTAGIVKPDGTSITVALDGTISATGGTGTIDNAFAVVDVGGTELEADGEDKLTLTAGTGISLTPNASDNSVEISATGGGGGLLPHFYITSEAGSTVTVTAPDGSTITPTLVSAGNWECDVPSYGAYTVTSVYNGDTATFTVNVDDVKEYQIAANHFEYTIYVTAPSGSSIRVADAGNTDVHTGTGTGSALAIAVHKKTTVYTITVTIDGVSKSDTVTTGSTSGGSSSVTIQFGTINLTLAVDFIGETITCVNGGTTISKTASSTSMAFYVPTTGTWVISGTVSGQTYSVNAVVSSLSTPVSATLETIPDGSTVLPTDDVQIWLNCAGIYDKTSYTTLADVLADHDTLQKVISNENATDYLVRSTTWASDICADSTAMRYIGKRNYAANTLIADSDWLMALASSDYADSVFNIKVPVMTSNSAPEGLAFAKTEYQGGYQAWKAFNGQLGSGDKYWRGNSDMPNTFIGYKFTSSVKIFALKLSSFVNGQTSVNPKDFTLQYSNDTTTGLDGTWNDLSDFINSNPTQAFQTFIPSDTPTSNIAWRILIKTVWNGTGTNTAVGALQFYGREDVNEANVDIYSAASDTVYYLDNGSPVTVCTTDASGHGTVSRSSLPVGTYTLYSTVADNPSNLSEKYSKSIDVYNSNIELNVMPDNCYYWYGYINNMEDVTAANGYSVSSGGSMLAPTKNTNNMYMSSGVSQFVLESTANTISSGKTVKALMDCTTVFSSVGSTLEAYATKNLGDGTSAIAADKFSAVSGIALKGFTLPSDGYIVAGSINRRAGHVYALWVEN